MLKHLPLKKEYTLIIATVILLLLSYKLAFKATIKALQTHQMLEKQLAQSVDLSYQPGYLERKNANLKKVISLYKADTISFRNNSINTISAIAGKENVKLSEVPVTDPIYHTDKFIIQRLYFEGDFFSMTRFISHLQTTPDIGIIRSLSYKTILSNGNISVAKKLVLEVDLEIAK